MAIYIYIYTQETSKSKVMATTDMFFMTGRAIWKHQFQHMELMFESTSLY